MNILWMKVQLIEEDILKSIEIFEKKLGINSNFFLIHLVNIVKSLKK